MALAGKTMLFWSVLLSGAVVTLPGTKLSFASVSSVAVDIERRSSPGQPPYLIGLRQIVQAAAPQLPFGSLSTEPISPTAQSGTLRYGRDAINLPFDEASGAYVFGPMRLKHALVKTIVDASYLAGVDPRLLMAIADKESSFVAGARASTSTATGLFQFIESTWLRALRDYGPSFGLDREAALLHGLESPAAALDAGDRARLLDMRNDPFLSTLMAAAMLRAEQEKLSARLGRTISSAEVYLVHFLGPAGAEKFLAVLADKPLSPAANLLPMAAKANRPIFFVDRTRKPKSLSVAQVHEKIGSSLERRLMRYSQLDFGPVTAFAPLLGRPELPGAPFANWRL